MHMCGRKARWQGADQQLSDDSRPLPTCRLKADFVSHNLFNEREADHRPAREDSSCHRLTATTVSDGIGVDAAHTAQQVQATR